jgi:hypothetical protein
MAQETKCQTPGAVFHTGISIHRLSMVVEFNRVLDLSEAEAELLDANLHNAVELVLARYFQ